MSFNFIVISLITILEAKKKLNKFFQDDTFRVWPSGSDSNSKTDT